MLKDALRTYLLEGAAFFALIEAVITGAFAASGVGRGIGIDVGVITVR